MKAYIEDSLPFYILSFFYALSCHFLQVFWFCIAYLCSLLNSNTEGKFENVLSCAGNC